MKYGYRVFQFKVTERLKRDTLVMDAALVQRLQDELRIAWGQGLAPYDGEPLYTDFLTHRPASDTGVTRLTPYGASDHGPTVRVRARAGVIGRDPYLLDSTGGSSSILASAAGHEFRHDFYFPTSGDTGIVVAETASRSNYLANVMRWTSWSQGMRDASAQGLTQASDGSLAPSDAQKCTWHRYIAHPLGDREHLRSLITEAPSAQVTFEGNTVGSAHNNSVVLTVPLNGEIQRSAVADEVLTWLDDDQSDPGRIARLFDRLNITQMDNTNVSFRLPRVKLGGVEPTTITPDNEAFADIFTYFLAEDQQVSDPDWLTKTSAKARELAQAWNISIG